MEYYCPYCNHLEEIESSHGPEDMLCDQCGNRLTALRKVAEPVPRGTLRRSLTILITVTGSLLAILWFSGGGKADQTNTLGMVEDLFDLFVSSIVFFVKVGMSLVIVACAVLIGTKLAAPKHGISETKSSEFIEPVEAPPGNEGIRTGLRVTSIVGMSFGTFMIVVTIVGAICLTLFVFWAVVQFIQDVALP